MKKPMHIAAVIGILLFAIVVIHGVRNHCEGAAGAAPYCPPGADMTPYGHPK